MEVAEGVHHFATGPFNWYVIDEGGRLTLVDAGFPGHYEVFAEGVRSLGRELKDVAAILLTHAHADHLGFAERVRRLTLAPVFIHRADVEKSRRRLQLPWIGLLSHAWRPYTAKMLTVATLHGVFPGQPVGKAFGFEDGASLDVPGRPIALHVPGHTPGEAAFYLPARKILISGDTLITRDLYTGREGEPTLAGEGLNYDTRLAAQSLDRLRGLGRLTMLPGHGRPWVGDMAQAVDGARASERSIQRSR